MRAFSGDVLALERSIPAKLLKAALEDQMSWTSTYRWIPIAGGFVSFVLAFVAGANDIPISFGAAVGSGVVTLRQSVVLALVMEVLGATVLGNHSIDVVESFIFRELPSRDLMMWGFMIAMIAAAIWLALATYMEKPVTSSLSIQGAVIGIALTTQGWNSIYWSKYESGSVLHVGGFAGIILSWVVVPLMSLVAAFSFFSFMKIMLLRSLVAEKRALQLLPPLYGITVMVLILFVIYRGAPGTSLDDMPLGEAAVIAASSAVFTIFMASLILVWRARKQSGLFDVSSMTTPDRATSVSQDTGQHENSDIEGPSPEELLKQFNELRVLHTVYEGDEEEAVDESPPPMVKCSPVCGPAIPLKQLLSGTPNRMSFHRLKQPKKVTTQQRILNYVQKCREYTFDHKIEYGRKTLVQHALAEKFDKKVEELFGFLLILTASLSAMDHGSNIVPFVMVPYAAILNIFRNHSAQATELNLDSLDVELWVRLLGGVGVSMGYGLWGWKLVRCLGGRLAFLSPSRAFSAQFCTLAVVLLSSKVKFPISAAHVFIGAIVGVSIADSAKNTNWRLLGCFIFMWGLTLVLTCGITSALYAFTIFSPSVSVGS
eukprot:c19483_g1_i3 orf=284-2083(+)